ncbi:hypothetical protein BCR44DRAFT_394600 [Catenaria anguillulae PL171]|uniref:Uncharacterized protein n=1 Tax=Catenaria anguillulae PL171 TaxID=765915 RepID=A0A1Y2HEQ0_9FUNG|nr:hypothetical protein BCR44DRAFT_394600 [Catenaria anguillulae PL171]
MRACTAAPAPSVGSAALIPNINLTEVRPHRLQWDAYCPVCVHARACIQDAAGRIVDVEPPTTCCGERSANSGMVFEFLSALNILPKCPDDLWNLADVSDAELRDKARAANRALQMGHFITERGALKKPVSGLERPLLFVPQGQLHLSHRPLTFAAARITRRQRAEQDYPPRHHGQARRGHGPHQPIRARVQAAPPPLSRSAPQNVQCLRVHARRRDVEKECRGLCLIVNKRVEACPPGFKVFKLDAGVPKECREAAAVAAAAAAAASAGALAGSTLGGSGGAAASVGSGSSTDGQDDDDDGEADAGAPPHDLYLKEGAYV